ncbi:MAG: TIGR03618 family F420-dependent PPOX class oxidoreductase [Caulobacter sp.]
MPKQRDLIKMSDDELAAFVQSRKSMMVASLGKDGAPHQTVLWFAVKDGRYLFETYGASQKVVNLRRDPRISLMWESGLDYNELRGVTVNGRAEIVDSEPRQSELMSVIIKRNNPAITDEALAAHVERMKRKRVVVVVHPEKVVSWDHTKLAALAH